MLSGRLPSREGANPPYPLRSWRIAQTSRSILPERHGVESPLSHTVSSTTRENTGLTSLSLRFAALESRASGDERAARDQPADVHTAGRRGPSCQKAKVM